MDKIVLACNAGLVIQMLSPEDLVSCLDGMADLGEDQTIDDLMTEKFMDLDPLLEGDLDMMGIEIPLFLEIDSGGWFLADGHHRLAWALDRKAPVPVCFLDMDVVMEGLYILCEDARDYDHKC